MAKDFSSDLYTGAPDKNCQEKKANDNYPEVSMTGPSHDLRFSCKSLIEQDENSKGVGPSTQKTNQLASNLTHEQRVLERTSMGVDPAPRGSSSAVSSDYGSNSSMVLDSESSSKNGISASSSERNYNSDSFINSSSSVTHPRNTVEEVKMFMKDFSEIAVISFGAYGQVFKARDEHDGKPYAIKCVKYDKKKMVEREAEVLAKLDHPNIVHYYSSWTACYTPVESDQKSSQIRYLFIQMKWCDKGTLEQWIDSRRDENPNKYLALELFEQIVEGVNYIHSKQLIHGDLKPNNIFLGDTNQINIGDFGLVKFQENGAKWSKYEGNETYMSPEQLSSSEYGKEVDIFALGLILAELLYITATRSETYKIFKDLRNGHVSDVFSDKEKILLQELVSKDPKKRPNTSEILKILKEWKSILEKNAKHLFASL